MSRQKLLQQGIGMTLILLFSVGCRSSPPATPISEILTATSELSAATSASNLEIKTSIGTLVIVDVLFSDRIPLECNPEAQFDRQSNACSLYTKGDHQLLLLRLDRAHGDHLEPHEIRELSSEGVYIISGDGFHTGDVLSAEKFVGVSFLVPTSAHDFKLFWPDNPPLELGK